MNKLSTFDTRDIINEGDSYFVDFWVTDGKTDAPVTITNAPIKLHVMGNTANVYSGSARSAISDTNLVTISLTPQDNRIYDRTTAAARGYEDRRILCNTFYSGGQQAVAFLYRIEYSSIHI